MSWLWTGLVGLVLLLLLGTTLTALIAAWAERRFPPGGRFVEVAGGRLHYAEAAPSGRESLGTVVLLHGASSSQADPMSAVGRHLAERYRVIAFDRPGHGWSDRIAGADAAQPARQAALVAEALRRLGVRRAVAVGHSWAGAVVPNLALDHSDVTGAILLLSGVAYPWPGGEISWYNHTATSRLGWLFTRTVAAPIGWLLLQPGIRAVFAPQEPPPDYAEQAQVPLVLRPSAFQANAEDIAGLYEAVAAQSPRYGAIRLPSTAIGGQADRIVWTDLHARSFARDVPSARLVTLPGIGHMPHYATADLVMAEIDRLAARVAEEPALSDLR